jgi:MFS family permease
MPRRRPAGFLAFTVIWVGQVLSTLGTRMTNFALSIFVWNTTGHATDLALMTFAAFAATAVFSPIAGSLIDRWNRRLTILMSDLGSAAATGLLLILFATHSVAVWHLYLVNILTGAALAFQAPVYGATISLMVKKGHFPRANAMLSLAQSIPGVFAPAVAVTVLHLADIKLILTVDIVSYLIAIGTVFLVVIPDRPEGEPEERRSVWRDSVIGFRFITAHRGLLGLQAILFTTYLFGVMGWLTLIPMVLARTGNNQAQLAIVQSVGAIGGAIGAALIGALRSTEHKLIRMLLAILVFNVFGRVFLGLGDSVVFWSIGWACAWGSIPVFLGYGQAIWQEKVPPELQGRVFAARNLLESIATPIALGLAGPLADYVFEPAMRPGGALAGLLGPVFGVGPGSGLAVIFVVTGLLGASTTLIGFKVPAVRHVETLLPDHTPGTPVPVVVAD